MNPKFITNRFSIGSPDIIVLNGKVYEFYEDGSGKLIRSQDITDISIIEDNAKVNHRKSCTSPNYSKTFEIHASQNINSLTVSTEEKINSDLTEIEYLKSRLKILMSELNKKCTILRKKKIKMIGSGTHDIKAVNSSVSDESSISMPILSPQLHRKNCGNGLEKLNVTSTTAKVFDGSVCNASSKMSINPINHDLNSSNITMPTLSPYYTTPSVFLSKKIDKNLKLLSKSKSTSVLPSHLQPIVSIVPLSKSLLSKYTVSNLLETSKRKLVKGNPASKRTKKASSTINSSSEFVYSPSKNKNVNNRKFKGKNVKLNNSVKRPVLSKNKKPKLKNGNSPQMKPKTSPIKSKSPKKSLSSAKKKSNSKPKKKLVMSSSLWINRDNDSSSSSPTSKKSLVVDSDTSLSDETCGASMKSSSPCSKVDLSKSYVKDSNDSHSSNGKMDTSDSEMETLVITDSDECDNDTISKSQNNMTSHTLKSSVTEFLTPNQSPSDSDSNYFTPPRNDTVLSEF